MEDKTLDQAKPFAFEANGIPYIGVPSNFSIREAGNPAVDKRTFSVVHADSFMLYTQNHRTPRTSINIRQAWPQSDKVLAESIMDDGAADGVTSWRAHTAEFAPKLTPQFQDWLNINKQPMSQMDFCEFLDEHALEIVRPDDDKNAPSSSEIVGFASNLHDVKKVEFKKSVNLNNGRVQISYNEKDDGEGSIMIPRNFYIRLRPVAGYGDVVTLYVNLRYRIVDGTKIVFILSFRNLDAFFDDLREKLTAEVIAKAQSELKIPVYFC